MPGIVLCEAHAPFIGGLVKRWKPGQGDNGIQGRITEILSADGKMNPNAKAWTVKVAWPDKDKEAVEVVTY